MLLLPLYCWLMSYKCTYTANALSSAIAHFMFVTCVILLLAFLLPFILGWQAIAGLPLRLGVLVFQPCTFFKIGQWLVALAHNHHPAPQEETMALLFQIQWNQVRWGCSSDLVFQTW